MSGAAGGHSSLYIVRGDGSGIFDDDAEITITAPQAVTAGDFNEDGHIDLAFSGTSILVTYQGTGDGGFVADQSHSLSAARQIMVGDLNLDGHTDLLTGSETLLSVGDGSFAEITAPNANVATLGDMNEDGIHDLIGATSVLLHYEGNGDGTFTLNSTTPLGASANAIELADIDADGHLDVVTIPLSALFTLTTGAAGDIPLPFVWPAGIPAGSELFFQYGIADPGAVVNVALSNGVRAVTP